MKHLIHMVCFSLIAGSMNAQVQLDPGFGMGGRALVNPLGGSAYFHSLAMQADGRIVCAGTASDAFGHTQALLCRFLTDGTLDATFSGDGILTFDPTTEGAGLTAVAVRTDGSIVAGGYGIHAGHQQMLAVRSLADGTFDPSFATAGIFRLEAVDVSSAECLELTADGGFLVGGVRNTIPYSGTMLVAKLASNGAIDATFGSSGTTEVQGTTEYGEAASMAILEDGSIALCGFAFSGGDAQVALARLYADGTQDMTFNGGTGILIGQLGGNWMVKVLASDASHFITAGSSYQQPSILTIVSRFGTDASVDPGFGNAGQSILVPEPGNALFAGSCTKDATDRIVNADLEIPPPLGTSVPGELRLGRLLSDGTVDVSFGTGGLFRTTGMDLQLHNMGDLLQNWGVEHGPVGMGLGNNRIYVCAGTFTDHSAVLMAFSETAGISTNIHGSAGHADALNVMPSPAGQFVWVIGPEGFAPEAIVITDGLGRLVQRIAVQGIAAKTTIDISALPDGLYTVQAIDRSSRAFGRLIVAR